MREFNQVSWSDIWDGVKAVNRVETGIAFVDDAIHGLFPGDVCLIGAKSGAGKTELAATIAQNVANQMKSVLYVACEAEKGEIEKRMAWKLISKEARIRLPHRKNLRYAEWRAGFYDDWIYEVEGHAKLRKLETQFNMQHSELRVHYPFEATNLADVGPLTGEAFAQILTSPISGGMYNLVILDHFHALTFEGRELFHSQASAINAIRIAADQSMTPVLIFGQFRKSSQYNKGPLPTMEEFSGSSEIYYRPQNVIVFGQKKSDGSNRRETYFQIVKARAAGDVRPFVGMHVFDTETNSYSASYEVLRGVDNSDPEPLGIDWKIPSWAKRARRHHGQSGFGNEN